MKKITPQFLKLWAKRLLVYFTGLYCMAIGVVLSVKSGLGVSPVGALANVLYQISMARNAPSFFNLGNWTIAVYCLYILTELILLRKKFKPAMLLQVVASVFFGQLVNAADLMLAWMPAAGNYGGQLLYLFGSIPMVAVGVMLYLSPNILPTPGDGMSLAISDVTGLSLGGSKTVFDCSMVVISAAVSLLFFHGLVGVREGTVISALLVGFVMRQMQKVCLPGLLRFVERENKIARALQQLAKGYQLDASGKPKIIIAIGREFGSGGYEIGKLLAEKMGIPFYDRKIDEMAAERSGLPMSKVEELERHMERELVYDFKNAVYDMHHDVMSPEERLFVAQTDAIREIAAGDESCVIMGRCADYVLYNNPNCFRIFIHAIPSARIQRTMNKYQISFDEAKAQMEQTDAARARHYKRFTGRQYGKQEYYHLGIDSGILGIEATTTMIIGTLKEWCAVRGTAPLSILEKK